MSTHTATIIWNRTNQNFLDKKYSRTHLWKFDGGVEVRASAAPDVIRPPLSDTDAIDPEEAFVASLSACHMLWFVALAAKYKYVLDHYEDHAVGLLEKNPQGKLAVTKITLRPKTVFSGDEKPSSDRIHELHKEAHNLCYIANSVSSDVRIEPVTS